VLEELNRAAIREWLAQLADVNEASTVKTRYRSLFPFCGWLFDKGEMTEHQVKTLSPPQPKSKPVPVLTDEEPGALMKACGGKDFADRRDEAVMRLLLDCGIRVSELRGLSVGGTDRDQGMAMVRGKGEKVCPIYFSARTARAVDRYLRLRSRHRWAHLDALFEIQRGALTPDGARER
jgi:site-specific recombinase XerC